ncbi:glucose-6-phosphate dehydrogenase [Pseudodesulfovibrio piezophilus]|uniref:Glucose-6-phosphate 1-dehydrogenase n=1 Tax=Pseudodesulfovibrio piezophilus (strain DSM 21447 / JCM 15486 / C1TLV30) TaxID=1322246 RepID=M1WM50_PSEP2|nr:glucose-6-phosphate dehydrogenase [Pseudodesulfovibrio piezophilus]CCH48990.1 Glucose-6-phosphate 1-dehydrogenase [Pseudodesulfovibrio piezophilus C1TLV30]
MADTNGIETCDYNTPKDPCAIVIFGATGDLAARKILPSLYALLCSGRLPDPSIIIGVSRSGLSHEEYRERTRQALVESNADMKCWEDFAPRLFYRSVDVNDVGTFTNLAGFIKDKESEFQTGGNRLFHLSVPPVAYEAIAQSLAHVGLAHEKDNWSRLVVEKPFGYDLESSRKLAAALKEGFKEKQIFRIDHYLAKETVQNMLMFRFANSIFEPVWNRQFIQSVHITAAESLGVEHRAGFYDHTGVLRDMFQNHMMQLLSLVAMEPPSIYEANRIRDEKAKIYRSLRPFPMDSLDENLVLGQYAAGMIKEKSVPSYVSEPGVSPNSTTPTFASMKAYIDNWRWQGVPFYITSGKRMSTKRTDIEVKFKEVPHSMFRNILGEHITANRLTLSIHPKEEVMLSFQAKTPGPGMCLRNVTMNFDYAMGHPLRLTAYEKVLLDVLMGDHTLFWRQDSVDLCWSYLTPMLKECECEEQAERLHLYKAGTDGPKKARGDW